MSYPSWRQTTRSKNLDSRLEEVAISEKSKGEKEIVKRYPKKKKEKRKMVREHRCKEDQEMRKSSEGCMRIEGKKSPRTSHDGTRIEKTQEQSTLL
jgi:hypothetical protein